MEHHVHKFLAILLITNVEVLRWSLYFLNDKSSWVDPVRSVLSHETLLATTGEYIIERCSYFDHFYVCLFGFVLVSMLTKLIYFLFVCLCFVCLFVSNLQRFVSISLMTSQSLLALFFHKWDQVTNCFLHYTSWLDNLWEERT